MEVPVVVTGAGLAGILTAYYLKQVGIRTVVLEADRIGRGQTKSSDGSNAGERKTEGIYMMTYCG
ncbi:MAG: FAD-binding oxidoreductase [Lachnospiraceae bacterium]|nr:FAD-binding oxidoreductase [Lachnospiraceae bacterium]